MAESIEPVTKEAETRPEGPRPGVGLALSGGGYRAMLFHLGAFLRLFELGLLKDMDRISSVSGGSITSAKIGLEWPRLGSRDDFFEHVVAPIRRLAVRTVGNGPNVVVEISDTGSGIAPNDLDRIFDPFVQIDRQPGESSDGGVGLGLVLPGDAAVLWIAFAMAAAMVG